MVMITVAECPQCWLVGAERQESFLYSVVSFFRNSITQWVQIFSVSISMGYTVTCSSLETPHGGSVRCVMCLPVPRSEERRAVIRI